MRRSRPPAPGRCGISHTRWATHGPATDRNAHPHVSTDGRIAVNTTGSTEAYPPEDADIVVDVVETGNSLKANGLIEVETLIKSATHAVSTRAAMNDPATMTLRPKARCSEAAIGRAAISAWPPGGNGTISRTGVADCASTLHENRNPPKTAAQ